MGKHVLTRRAFLMATTTSAVMTFSKAAAAPNTAKVVPRKLSPNEKLNVAAIGAGGKGFSDIMACTNENVLALCDPDWDRPKEAFARIPNAKKYRDYRIMLEELPELDAVTISTPDHTHAPAAYMAMKLGKHVYVQKPLTHTVAEARLQALQARIRPHFLFNSLNAVLALIRRDPKRAEGALEDLAELFRSLMADNRQLVPMREEIVLCRQYLNLEHLRLGARLQVEWSVDVAAEGALVPPMLLQPLVENAVYHGIEPGMAPGAIEIRIGLEKDRVHVALSNPYHAEHQHRQGNRMALANIRERLQLHFDVEASLEAGVDGERYRIDMIMPYRKAP